MDPNLLVEFSYDRLQEIIDPDILENIPAIKALSHSLNNRRRVRSMPETKSKMSYKPNPDDRFIDLADLAENVFFMIIRESLGQNA
jgi:hypothetical protein